MSLFAKLRFKAAAPVHVLGDAAGASLFAADEGYSLVTKLPAKEDAGLQQVILFVRDAAALQHDFAALAPQLADGAILWIAYPKKSGSIQSDLTRDAGWKVVDKWGYVGVSQASLDADWSGLWFKRPEEIRHMKRGTPMTERVTEGVDYKARTVSLPADAAGAIGVVPELLDFFNGFSFSHKREWAEAIADAKKPETRSRRIARLVEQLILQKEEKAAMTAVKKTS